MGGCPDAQATRNEMKEKRRQQEVPERPAAENFADAFPRVASAVSAIELYTPLYLNNGLLDQADGFAAMAALVGRGHLKLVPGDTKVLQSGLHVGLVRPDTSYQKAAEEDRG